MADRTAPVVKLTLTSNPNPNPNIAGRARVRRRLGTRHGGRTGHNLAKTGTSQTDDYEDRNLRKYNADRLLEA